jgi:hypothetical protein
VKRKYGKDFTVSFNYRKNLLIPWTIVLDRYDDSFVLFNNYLFFLFSYEKKIILINIHTGCRIRLINSVRYVVSNLARDCCCHWELSCAWIFWIAFVGAKSGSLKNIEIEKKILSIVNKKIISLNKIWNRIKSCKRHLNPKNRFFFFFWLKKRMTLLTKLSTPSYFFLLFVYRHVYIYIYIYKCVCCCYCSVFLSTTKHSKVSCLGTLFFTDYSMCSIPE